MSGTIHDLGYKRYAGTRRATSTRWRVIARHQLAMSWKPWWKWKLTIVQALTPVVVAGVLLFVFSDKLLGGFARSGVSVTLLNATLPLTLPWFCKIAFIATLVMGTSIVAGDLQSGAFVFYFARSTRPIDYLLGKVVGLGAVLASVLAAGPTLIAIMRVALATTDTDKLVDQLVIIPEAFAIGLLATLVYTALPLAFSAIVGNRRYALGLWAGYYLIGTNIAIGAGVALDISWLRALDPATAITALGNNAFHMPSLLEGKLDVPTPVAIVMLLAHSALALGIVYWRLREAQKVGVGGAT